MTVGEELEGLVPKETEMVSLEFGLHQSPDELRSKLQEEIDRTRDVDAILLGYGLCSMGTVGLSSSHCRLVIPHTHDCIGIFLGSNQKYEEQFQHEPGTYYLTKGWINHVGDPYTVFLKWQKKYGTAKARFCLKKTFGNYTRLAFIQTGKGDQTQYIAHARKVARKLGLRFEKIEGRRSILKKMISEEWDGNAWKLIKLPSQRDTNEINKQSEQITEEKETSVTEIIADSADIIPVPEEDGYIDLIEEFNTATESITFSFGKMSEYILDIGDKFHIHTESFNKLEKKYRNKPKTGGRINNKLKYIAEVKKIVNNSASDLESYTAKMRPQISTLKIYLPVTLNRFCDVYIFANENFEMSDEQKRKDTESLLEVIVNMETVVGQIISFQESIANLPAFTAQFNKARKHAATLLGELIAEIKIAIDQGNDILKQIG